ncbi:preprotein translocase subunit SecY [Octadecabacter sp. 1_MG-2023]|uniref:preprotein translocase subunit SecY n=1 Tax=Octadecabacter TaxID=53945 RepID=UPI001C0A2D30|nr:MULTISPECIES: preprotein translocase subunit SecY [Octadecabacter]MBU2991628.1 preprotein translocase subunit SecY [Octadecabacter sp. B2R22]MCF2905657.1 preprotein translocase subunit SecY [Octadecabacter algicola]MDO6736155.1 preprotein translocase subunit SecY [Octadecabacter sp. 1_MG-2023]
MASAAEQMAANTSWSAFGQAKELRQRIMFTLGLLIVYRVGTYIPVPGIDADQLRAFMDEAASGIGGILSMFTGGALGRMGIFALGIMPYISASIIVQLLGAMWEPLKNLKKEGEQGRKKLNQYTRYGTVVLATFQAYGMASGLEAGNLVTDPGLYFKIACVITLVGGTMFLMWLGEQITARGIGNGISLIIFVGIIAEVPAALAGFLAQGQETNNWGLVLGVFVMVIAIFAFVVFMERSLRKIHIQYPRRQVGMKVYDGGSSHLPIKVNPAGVIPAIFASALLLLPTTLSTFSGGDGAGPIMSTILAYFGPGQPLYLIFFTAMIVFFTFFYTREVAFKTDEVADNLKNQNGFVPGIRPGKRTQEYLDYVVTRILVLGSAYLALVCLLPEILRSQLSIPFYFGGTSVLIIVSVGMDTIQQIQSHLLAHQYEGLIEKSQLRGKRGGKKRSPQRK